MLLTEYEYFQCFNVYTSTYRLIYLKSTKSTKFLTCLKSVESVI